MRLVLYFLLGFGLLAVVFISSVGYVGYREHDVLYPFGIHTYRSTPLGGQCSIGDIPNNGICEADFPVPRAVDLRLVENETSPCEDFYQYACGKWIKEHQIGSIMDRSFTAIFQQNAKIANDIVVSDTSVINQMYLSCYNTFVLGQDDSYQREIQKDMSQIDQAESSEEVLAYLVSNGFTSPFAVTVETHPSESTFLVMLQPMTFEGINRDIIRSYFEGYFSSEESIYMTNLLVNALQVLDSQYDKIRHYNYRYYVLSEKIRSDLFEFEELQNIIPNFNWSTFFSKVYHHNQQQFDDSYQDTRLVMKRNSLTLSRKKNRVRREFKPTFSTATFLNNVKQHSLWLHSHHYFLSGSTWPFSLTLEHWKAYARFSILYHSTDFTPWLPEDVYFKRHEPTASRKYSFMTANSKIKNNKNPRDTDLYNEQCIATTQYLLPGKLAKKFLSRKFPTETIHDKTLRVAEGIRTSLIEIISKSPWLSDRSKSLITEKINSIIIRSVHPTHWTEEPFDELNSRGYLENLNKIRRLRVQRNLDVLISGEHDNIFDRDVASGFSGAIYTVNAWYSPTMNTITIYAGILSRPFMDELYDPISVYAGIGMIIGHELSHSMDASGVNFDKEGNLDSVFSSIERKKFDQKSQCLVRAYGQPCGNVDYGRNTLSENIADNFGIRAAYSALKRDYPETTKEDMKDFFLAFAQNWCQSTTKQARCRRVFSDVHALNEKRVNQPLRTLEEFVQTYDCGRSDWMWGDHRCEIYG